MIVRKPVSAPILRQRREPDGGGALPAGGAPTALYQQLKEYVAARIHDGTWPAGQRLPSENELVRQFEMSRMTVNRALRELAAQGAIVRVPGVGSFVAEAKPQSTLFEIANLADEIQGRGHRYRCEVLRVEKVPAPPETRAFFGMGAADKVFHAVCVHFDNDVPVQLEQRYVNPAMAPAFLKQDFSVLQPSDYLVRNVPYDEMEHVVDAVMPDAEQARLLQVPRRLPGLLLTRRTWLRQQPITLAFLLHPASRYRLGGRFHKDRPAG